MKTIDDLKIKNKIILFNREYSIEYPLQVDDDNDGLTMTTGLANFDTQIIKLLSDSHPESQLRTLLHELAHIAFYEFVGVAETINLEIACDAVSAMLYDMCHNFDIKYRGDK